MALYISPVHSVPPCPNVFEGDLDYRIDVFYRHVDGWHLEVADRVINGWETNGKPSINTVHLNGWPADCIPDSGWAVLQKIVLNYFETIAYFKCKELRGERNSKKRFRWGLIDVFPEMRPYESEVMPILYGGLRGGLYHVAINKGMVVIRHAIETKPLEYDAEHQIVIIDPHKFVPHLRKHFKEYVDELNDPENVESRDTFDEALRAIYRR